MGRNGQVIVDYSLYDARRAGFETVIFVIKHEIEDAFKAAIGDRVSKVMDVKYAFQQLDELPEGFSIPEAVSSLGHLPRGSGRKAVHQRPLCRHQCGRLLRPAGIQSDVRLPFHPRRTAKCTITAW